VTILKLRAGLVAVLAALVTATGCQQAVQQRSASEPGQMPGRTETDRTPRLNATTYFAHGHLLERQGEFERAIAQYRQALELTPNFVSARNRLGITLNKLGQHSLASAEFRKVLETHPHLTYVQNNLGFSYYLEGKYELAEATLRDALARKPSFPRARMNYGVVLGKLGRLREAFEQFRQAGSEADAYYNVALLQTEAGLYADAARSLDTALRLNPKLEAARHQLRDVSHLAAAEVASAPGTLASAADVQAVTASEPTTIITAESASPPALSAGVQAAAPEPSAAAEEPLVVPEEPQAVVEEPSAAAVITPNPERERGGISDETRFAAAHDDPQQSFPAPHQPDVDGNGSFLAANAMDALDPATELFLPYSPFLPADDAGEGDCDAAQREEAASAEVNEEVAAWLRELHRYLAELTGQVGDRWCELRERLLRLAGTGKAADSGTAE
jgi:Flp pilus assembly protein TadD